MELGRKLLPPNVERVTVIFDMTGFGPQHMDLSFARVRSWRTRPRVVRAINRAETSPRVRGRTGTAVLCDRAGALLSRDTGARPDHERALGVSAVLAHDFALAGRERPPKGFPSSHTIGRLRVCLAPRQLTLNHDDPVDVVDVRPARSRRLSLSTASTRSTCTSSASTCPKPLAATWTTQSTPSCPTCTIPRSSPS